MAVTGVATVMRAKDKKMRWLATIPLAFSIQQAIEGFQWLTPRPSELSMILGYGFLFFAFLFWLVAIPALVGWIEPDKLKKQALRFFTLLGAAAAVYGLFFMVTEPLTVCLNDSRIVYQVAIPLLDYGLVIYVLVTCGSLLMSSHKKIQLFGGLAFLSLLVTIIIFREALTSVWCFFAALLSTIILWQAVSYKNKKI